MANVTDIFVKPKTVSSDTNSSSLEKESVKEQPSLFDSLLKESLDKEVVSEEKIEPKKIDSNKEKVLSKEEVKTETKETPNEIKSSSTSLLDRLLLEAKTEIGNGSKIILKNDLVKDSSSLSQESDTKTIISDDSLATNLNKLESEKTAEIVDGTANLVENSETKNVETPKVIDETVDLVDESSKEDLLNNIETSKVIDETAEVIDKNNLDNLVLTKDESNKENLSNKDISSVIDETAEVLNKSNLVNLGVVKKDESNKENVLNNIENIEVEETVKVADIKTDENKTVVKLEVESIIVENDTDVVTIQVETDLINTTTVESDIISDSSKDELLLNQAVSKDTINPETKIEKKKSLMDLLIEKNMEKANVKVLDESIINPTTIEGETVSKDILSSIYLGGQKNLINSQALFNRSEALSLLKEGASLGDIEKSANILELGVEDINVEQNIEVQNLGVVKKQDVDGLNKKNLLDSLLNEKSIRSDDIKNLITKSVDASAALLDNSLNVSDEVTVNVNSPIAYNIQSRIIGAKQQMATMMSDIARQMYENYKPPVTVFKINLNPLELGSISILMKNDKNNALSISMSVSNVTTLDALVDNQNVLRNSLNKTFDENTRFNLDFSSSEQNNNQSSNNQNGQNNQNRRFENQMDTQSVLQLKEENKDREENLDYM